MSRFSEIIKKGWQWLVKSSVNADKWSLTAKSFLAAIIPYVLIVTKATHIQFDNAQATAWTDIIVQVIAYIGAIVTSITGLIGFIRKISRTAVGTNDVVQSWAQGE